MEALRNSISPPRLWILVITLTHWCSIISSAASSTFTISNYCPHPIWPGTLAGAGTPQLSTTGFRLDPGQSAQVAAPPGWSGRVWARTGCAFDAGAGSGSLVDGYNLPVVAVPRARQGGGCNATGCAADLNRSCPKELQVDGGGGGVVACRSACEAFGQDQYCCSGAYATPDTCRPTAYSSVFKAACPRAYSYAYDDGSSTFTCAAAADYTIAFCLPPTGLHTPDDGQSTGGSRDAGGTPPPAIDSGGAANGTPPLPPTDNNGAGSFGQPPPTTTSGGPGSIYRQPWMVPSSATTRRSHLSLLLTAVLLYLF
ncbi:hypothetical protein QOZ80_8AG0637650 [Eleusine coracana subsp. coracana]|nr:hypothetical protein QOZ80_8AG0637650 [Eleusine coracana subsp. coracana]